ncbi:RluA family pseudouridine synthase [Trichlorobacter lovleyi]|uniref:Pseudouridine synthase, RluA family n=1 Tax=Trichlorobacter lovleyi (strain ATCC BAA-1151 / DSM 17278 / SZ) TaxID=398767 RepID=B3E6K8_TRIL1|nr:RluA family pseudouridine synthase [Trichlorobacter lovleyi]ACD94833.1 pseudouridine synthase, RluA family [Trichlorobacter lovleyi SZ]
MLTYTITADDHCRRLESWLQRLLPTALPAYCRKLIKSGACTLNGTKSSPDTLLSAGAIISLKESGQVLELLNRPLPPIDLLWQDDRLLAINKPAGLAMHPAAEVDENLADIASAWLEKKANYPVRAYPVNRLDRGTSGVVLLATSSSNAGILGRQVKEEGLDKIYLTVVEGMLEGIGEISQPLDGKESISRYRSLSVGESCSFLLVEPVTGRTHQIRRHLSAIGHPVLGDKRYDAQPLATLPGIALHSFRTRLQHPTPETRLTLCAPLPTALRELIIERCGIDEKELLDLLTNLEGPATT